MITDLDLFIVKGKRFASSGFKIGLFPAVSAHTDTEGMRREVHTNLRIDDQRGGSVDNTNCLSYLKCIYRRALGLDFNVIIKSKQVFNIIFIISLYFPRIYCYSLLIVFLWVQPTPAVKLLFTVIHPAKQRILQYKLCTLICFLLFDCGLIFI